MPGRLLSLCVVIGTISVVSRAAPLEAQSGEPPEDDRHALELRLPLAVAPYNFIEGYRAPSMSQSLEVTTSFYSVGHWGLSELMGLIPVEKPWFQPAASWAAIQVFDLLTVTLPPGIGWLHEEWHRGVLGQQGIASRNQINEIFSPPEVAGIYKVYGLSDDELVALKADDPANIVRLALAGDEALDALSHELQRRTFFYGETGWRWGPAWVSTRRHQTLYWLNWISHWGYIGGVVAGGLDAKAAELNELEPSEESRDFMGPDFSGYVYDLFRPDEPYDARGPHPSGVGIDRYITTADLTDEELAYLRNQKNLHALNLLNPHLFGFEAFVLADGTRLNAAVHHGLAPFGHELGLDGMLTVRGLDLSGSLRLYRNRELVLPGLDVTLFDLRISDSMPLFVSPHLGLWVQPSDLRFDSESSFFGGIAGAEIEWRPRPWGGVFAAADGKTRGFATGHESLDAGLRASVGVVVHVP